MISILCATALRFANKVSEEITAIMFVIGVLEMLMCGALILDVYA